MKVIERKDLSDIHRRIDLIQDVVREMIRSLPVELGDVTASDMLELLDTNDWKHD